MSSHRGTRALNGGAGGRLRVGCFALGDAPQRDWPALGAVPPGSARSRRVHASLPPTPALQNEALLVRVLPPLASLRAAPVSPGSRGLAALRAERRPPGNARQAQGTEGGGGLGTGPLASRKALRELWVAQLGEEGGWHSLVAGRGTPLSWLPRLPASAHSGASWARSAPGTARAAPARAAQERD